MLHIKLGLFFGTIIGDFQRTNLLIMKIIYLIIALSLTTFSFAQSRKSLLKEINNYKYKVCKSTSYQSLTNQQLLQLSNEYFKKNGYKVARSTDSSMTFIKRTTASIVTTWDKVKHLIYLDIKTINSLKKIILDHETVFYKPPLSGGTTPPRSRGTFYLDKKALIINICIINYAAMM